MPRYITFSVSNGRVFIKNEENKLVGNYPLEDVFSKRGFEEGAFQNEEVIGFAEKVIAAHCPGVNFERIESHNTYINGNSISDEELKKMYNSIDDATNNPEYLKSLSSIEQNSSETTKKDVVSFLMSQQLNFPKL